MPPPNEAPAGLVDHYFRHEYGRLVSTLARRYHSVQLEVIEDCVQNAMLAALGAWRASGAPEQPAAWLYRTANNQLIDTLRREVTYQRVLQRPDGDTDTCEPLAPRLPAEIRDDQLRMLFVCCDPAIAPESQLVLALKVLCGFSTGEIALRLFTTEANVHKRLGRARERLRELNLSTDTPDEASLRARLDGVHAVIYLLFNEGYHSVQTDRIVRKELCDEAIRLATLVAEHPVGAVSQTYALLALMHFHAARLESRVDGAGGLLLLEEQDRSRWDQQHIHEAIRWCANSPVGERLSKYHAEAAIAGEHCFAKSFAQTRWSEIAEWYDLLNAVAPSPIHLMNRAIAIAQFKGPDAGLAELEAVRPPSWLLGYYLWDAVLGELHRQARHTDEARAHLQRALESAPTEPERALMRKRLALL